MGKNIIAIDLGGTSAKLAIVTPKGDIINQWSVPTDNKNQGRHIVPTLIESIQDYIKTHNMSLNSIMGIGMGSPGKVNTKEGTVIGAYNLNWKELQDIQTQFKSAFNLPFVIANDANVAALGEQWQGAGNNEPNVVMVTLGTGVGGGIVNEGHLVYGQEGAAGEIGHLIVDPNLPFLCTCGNRGCLESVASATGLMNLVKYSIQNCPEDSLLKNKSLEKLESKDVFDAAKAGDQYAEDIIEHYSKYLGLACSHIANMLNPKRIVLGGGVSLAGDYLLSKVDRYFRDFCFPPLRDSTDLVLAELGADAGVLGAAQLLNLVKE